MIMGHARVCDKCKYILEYTPDTQIKIYVHPFGYTHYELCPKCTEELKTWLNSKNPFSTKENQK